MCITWYVFVCVCVCVIDFLGKQLDDYVATLPVPTYIERMGTRSGLIRARLRGSLADNNNNNNNTNGMCYHSPYLPPNCQLRHRAITVFGPRILKVNIDLYSALS